LQGDSGRPRRPGLPRGRDPPARQEHTGGSPRLPRPEPAVPRRVVRPAAEPPALQAAPHGVRV
jgi:hypothetical protein